MHIYLERLKALGDVTRFRLVRVLEHAGGELCICELVDILRRPQYAISRAVAALRAAGIVQERREGKLVYYGITDDPFVRRLAALLRTVPADDDSFRHDLDRLRWRVDIRSKGRCIVTYREEEASPTERPRVLFLCVHNSARSQIAEEYLKILGGELFEVESAGLQPGTLNPYVVEALAEEGIDISGKTPRGVMEIYRSGQTYDYVIMVCSREAEKNCPLFPGPVVRLSWPFPDPSRFVGSSEEIFGQVTDLRERIRERVTGFVDDYCRRHGMQNELREGA